VLVVGYRVDAPPWHETHVLHPALLAVTLFQRGCCNPIPEHSHIQMCFGSRRAGGSLTEYPHKSPDTRANSAGPFSGETPSTVQTHAILQARIKLVHCSLGSAAAEGKHRPSGSQPHCCAWRTVQIAQPPRSRTDWLAVVSTAEDCGAVSDV